MRELFDKARFGLPGMIGDEGTMDAGIFEDGAQRVRDTSNTALGALHAGHFELARAALVRILTKMITPEGATMIAGSFDSPDREQFDQMGELLHCLRDYCDWTGDDSLVREHRQLLLALIERPQPRFRDDTGMVHNRREFWERTFEDAYELAYQTYVYLGLREAIIWAPLRRPGPSGALGTGGRADSKGHARTPHSRPGGPGTPHQASQPHRGGGGPADELSRLSAGRASEHREASPAASGRLDGPAHRLGRRRTPF